MIIKQNIKKNVLTLQSSSELNNTNITDDSIFEFDVNRNLLCGKIVDKMAEGEIQQNIPQPAQTTSKYQPPQPKKAEKSPNVNSAAYRENQLSTYMKELVIAEYNVSYGNVVANHKASVTFTVSNLNKGQISFTIDKKDMAAKGYTVVNGTSNDRCYIDEGKSVNITVTHNTSSNNANIDVNNVLKIVMSNGEVYFIYIHLFLFLIYL